MNVTYLYYKYIFLNAIVPMLVVFAIKPLNIDQPNHSVICQFEVFFNIKVKYSSFFSRCEEKETVLSKI